MINKKNVKSILISRTDRLGDVILTLPLVSTVKKIFPGCKLFFFSKNYVSHLISGYTGIDEIIDEESTGSFYGKWKFFRNKKPDLVINVKPRFDLAFLFFLMRIKYRIGTAYRWYSFLYNCRVFEHRKNSGKHESELNLNLILNFFGEDFADRRYYFFYDDIERNKLSFKLEKLRLSLTDRYIIIHPGSGGSSKDLPPEKLSEFIDIFLGHYAGFRIVFTGLKNESLLCEEIISGVKSGEKEMLINLCGELDLRELMILIDNSELFVSNSTGPVHIAGALNKNIIAFYPNEKEMSAVRWKPPGDNVKIISPDSTGEMRTISAAEIFEHVKKFFIN